MAIFPKNCPQCNAPIREGARFCVECGLKIEPIEEAPIPEIKEELPLVIENNNEEEIKEEIPAVTPQMEEEQPQEEIVEEPLPVEEEAEVIEEQQPEIIAELEPEQPVIENKEEQPQEPLQEEPKQEEAPAEVDERPIEQRIDEGEAPIDIAAAAATGAYLGYIFGRHEKPKNYLVEPNPEDLLEPRKKYVEELRQKHHDNASNYFDDLVQKSGVNAEENRETNRQIKKYEAERDRYQYRIAKRSAKKPMYTWGMISMLVGLMAATIFITLKIVDDREEMFVAKHFVLLLVISIILSVGGIAMMIVDTILRKRLKKALDPKIQAADKKATELKEIAYQQMAPLNNLFDFNILNDLSEKTAPMIQLDDHPDSEKIEQLINKYGWFQSNDVHHSAFYLKTGHILGNPFLLYSGRTQGMVDHTYTGSLTITWTKKVTIGKTTTYIPMTQVLTASVTKPKPSYGHEMYLVYGNEAAPNLTFSRHPMIFKYDEKSLKKLFKDREKEVDAYAKKHPNFTPLGNDEFEDFFDGTNRDNEMEYRLLFTPLAQKSILDIIKNRDPVGDNFSFFKKKMLNRITNSSTNVELEGDPRLFQGYDIDAMKTNFIRINEEFFRYIYFLLAPILAIPIYQQHKPKEYIYRDDRKSYYSNFILEMLANRFYPKFFAHEANKTDLILKPEEVRINGNSIQSRIHSYGYTTVAHTEYFSKLGGDGHWHNVPVTWYEYIPVEKSSPFVVHETWASKQVYDTLGSDSEYQNIYRQVHNNDFSFTRGYFTFIKDNDSRYDPSPLNELLKKRMEKKD